MSCAECACCMRVNPFQLVHMGYCEKLRRKYSFDRVRSGGSSSTTRRSSSSIATMENPDVVLWTKRWRIAIGAARGLQYLHEESQVRCAGQPNDVTQSPTVSRSAMPSGLGMSCFLAPENVEPDSSTVKADVYAFGIMLLELITGRKAVDTTRARGPMTLLEWAKPLIQAGNTAELVDPRLRNVYNITQLHNMVDAARRCINFASLPTMSEVLEILERNSRTPARTMRQILIQSPIHIRPRKRELSYCDMLC